MTLSSASESLSQHLITHHSSLITTNTMDQFIEQTPFFTPAQRTLAASVADFATREIEPRAAESDDEDARFREMLSLLADSGLLRFAVAEAGVRFDTRSLCLIREALSYSSSLADLAFVMQGLGTYAISLAAPEHVREFWLERAATGKAIAAFALTEPDAGSDIAAIKTTAHRDSQNGRRVLRD